MDRINVIIIGSSIALAGGFVAIAFYLARRKGNTSLLQTSDKNSENQIKSTTKAGISAITNEESWAWEDYAGRERKITVHRKVNYS